ncbi:DUF488 domain-containing protein [Paenibacillus fonticola]|uniref:DUF488 domain-containing protein n=1 Tax=Paenibacillus fonticola TaxID=379896 RepID=UPI000382D898|nr:DUF488 family protein [Paenibacillus fonticola]
MLNIKRVYEEPASGDGRRVLVDRIWPRGLRKESASLSLWMKEIAPSTELRKWFDHRPERFHEFRKRYTIELAAAERQAYLEQLRSWMEQGTVTLLYAAKDPVHNHAVVLKQVLDRK